MGWDNDSPIHAMTNEKLPPIFGLEALLFQGFLWLSGCCHPGHKRSASFLCYSPRTGVLSDVRRLIHEWLDGPELRNLPPEIGAHERGVRNDTDPSEIEPVSVPAGPYDRLVMALAIGMPHAGVAKEFEAVIGKIVGDAAQGSGVFGPSRSNSSGRAEVTHFRALGSSESFQPTGKKLQGHQVLTPCGTADGNKCTQTSVARRNIHTSMSLTYQPFAESPAVDDLKRELRMNVSDEERVASGVLGLGLSAVALGRDGFARWTLVLMGGALLFRAWSGRCPLYRKIKSDKRHPHAGVQGNRAQRIEGSVDISCPAETLFHFWRKLENLPRVMRHVKSVEQHSGNRSHWKVAGPVGHTFEWEAEIINEVEGSLIAWQSLAGASVNNSGSVWFEPAAEGVTRVKVALAYEPPAGAVGLAVAEWLSATPEADLAEDLRQFKAFAERELREPV